MNETEKLIELIGGTRYGNENRSSVGTNFQRGFIEKIANHLLANGVRLETKQATSDKTSDKPELKPCPFCGANAKLLHSGIEKTRSRDNGDLITSWRVLCQNCGTEQKGGVSEYVFNSDETISLKDPHFDGRSQAIKAWNRRAVYAD